MKLDNKENKDADGIIMSTDTISIKFTMDLFNRLSSYHFLLKLLILSVHTIQEIILVLLFVSLIIPPATEGKWGVYWFEPFQTSRTYVMLIYSSLKTRKIYGLSPKSNTWDSWVLGSGDDPYNFLVFMDF